MVSSSEILAAFREVSNSKQLDRSELYALLQEKILPRSPRNTVEHPGEVNIDDSKHSHRVPENHHRQHRGLSRDHA
jgi:hypothetical protein